MYAMNVTELASYPGVKIPTADTGALIVRLTEGEINGVIGDATIDRESVDPVAFEVAARALRNPTGATSITSGIDDWKQTLRYEGQTAAATKAGVYLTDEETRKLRILAGVIPARRRARRGSIVTRPGW